MPSASESTGGAGRLDVFDLEAPPPTLSARHTHGRLTPRQQLHFYSPEDWEAFVREWASSLTVYVQVKRLGSAGDAGADVAGFKSEDGFEGPWDCYQCKHYAKPLLPSDAYPEMLKVLRHVLEGTYTFPEKYGFTAPQGVGPSLGKLLSKPKALREAFLAWLEGDSSAVRTLTDSVRGQVAELTKASNFAIFQSVELEDLLADHRGTPFHVERFGVALPARGPVTGPPAEHTSAEARYIAQLHDVYKERHPDLDCSIEDLSSHTIVGNHFQRQRFAFYSAEALRLHARDSVPVETFDALVDDVYEGVVEVAEAPTASGWDRLDRVLGQSAAIDLSSHVLVSITSQADRKGLCHRLANEDRLRWVVDP